MMKSLRMLLCAVLFFPLLSPAQTPKAATTAQPVKTQPASLPVRGVSFEYFKSSVPNFADTSKQKALATTAWQLWKAEKWTALQKFFNTNALNGTPPNCWPPNFGGVTLKIITLKAGLLVSRYGGWYTADSVFHDKGTFVSMKNVPFPQRALPPSALKSPYMVYKVAKPIPNVKAGQIIPWFGEPGLAMQYQLPYGIDDLKKGGYLVPQKQ